MSLILVTVTGSWFNADGTPATGNVSFELQTVMLDPNDRIISTAPIIVPLDSSGHISVQLYANDSVSVVPTGVKYFVIEDIDGSSPRSYDLILSYNVSVLDLSNVLPPVTQADDPATKQDVYDETARAVSAEAAINTTLVTKVNTTDSRLSDSRTPVAGSVTDTSVANNAAIAESKLNLASDAAVNVASRRTLGPGATQAAPGNDARFFDKRVPTDGSVGDTQVSTISESKISGLTDDLAATEKTANKNTPNATGYMGMGADGRGAMPPKLHASSHGFAGSDPVTPAAIGADPAGAATTAQTAAQAYATFLDGTNVHLTGNETINGIKTFSSSPIVPDPTTGTQAANKEYVDFLSIKKNVKVAASANLGTSGLPMVDGYQLVDNDRILLPFQTNAVNNGVWVVHTGSWTRPTDFATGSDATGVQVYVTSGQQYKGSLWVVSPYGGTIPVLIDTVLQVWSRLDGIKVDPRRLGAFCDGSNHPLSTRFSTLSAAQAVYPKAQALTDQIDWCAIQLAVDIAKLLNGNRGGIVEWEGESIINRPISLPLTGNTPVNVVMLWGHGPRVTKLRGSSVASGHATDFPTGRGLIEWGWQWTVTDAQTTAGSIDVFSTSGQFSPELANNSVANYFFPYSWDVPLSVSDASTTNGSIDVFSSGNNFTADMVGRLFPFNTRPGSLTSVSKFVDAGHIQLSLAAINTGVGTASMPLGYLKVATYIDPTHIQIEHPATASNTGTVTMTQAARAWHQDIRNIGFLQPNIFDVRAMWRQLQGPSANYNDIHGQSLQVDLTNVVFECSNDFHPRMLRLEGQVEYSSWNDVFGDPTYGTLTGPAYLKYDTVLIDLDDTIPDRAADAFGLPPIGLNGIDAPGLYMCELHNILSMIRRGGSCRLVAGRLGRVNITTGFINGSHNRGAGCEIVNGFGYNINNLSSEGYSDGCYYNIRCRSGRFINNGVGTPNPNSQYPPWGAANGTRPGNSRITTSWPVVPAGYMVTATGQGSGQNVWPQGSRVWLSRNGGTAGNVEPNFAGVSPSQVTDNGITWVDMGIDSALTRAWGGKWAASQSILKGQIICKSDGTGHWFKASNAGTTGVGEPSWPAPATVTDGTVTWEDAGPTSGDGYRFIDSTDCYSSGRHSQPGGVAFSDNGAYLVWINGESARIGITDLQAPVKAGGSTFGTEVLLEAPTTAYCYVEGWNVSSSYAVQSVGNRPPLGDTSVVRLQVTDALVVPILDRQPVDGDHTLTPVDGTASWDRTNGGKLWVRSSGFYVPIFASGAPADDLDFLSTFGPQPGAMANATANVAVLAANAGLGVLIKPRRNVNLAFLRWMMGTTSSGNYDIGIYDNSGNRLWSKLSFAGSALAAPSIGQTLPQSTITVISTTGYSSPNGSINVPVTSGVDVVTYTGITSTTFTGCTGGTHTMVAGTVTPNGISVPTSVSMTDGPGTSSTVSLIAGNSYWLLISADNTSNTFRGASAGASALLTTLTGGGAVRSFSNTYPLPPSITISSGTVNGRIPAVTLTEA